MISQGEGKKATMITGFSSSGIRVDGSFIY